MTANNTGALRFVSSAFWGPSAAIASVAGTGSVGFSDCVFVTFDAARNSSATPAAITLTGNASLLVRGCEFQTAHAGGQLLLAAGSGKAIFTDNIITGALNVTNLGARVAIVKDNAADE